MIKKSILLMLPGAATTLVVYALLRLAPPDSAVLLDAAHGFPYLVLGAAAVLSWRLRSTRLFAASLLAGATYIVLQPTAVGNEALATALFAICAPPGVALLAFVPERGFSVARAATNSAIAFFPLAVLSFLTAGRDNAAAGLTANHFDPIYTDWSGLPQSALFVLIIAMAAVGVRFVMRPRAVDAALFWALPVLAAAIAAPAESTARGIWINAGAIVLIIAVIETAHAMAFYDELTGLPSRRALTQALSSLRAPYAVAIVDIDHFKSFNDEHGHDVGDQVLRMVAARLSNVSGGGTAYRSGGEEFTLVFPGVTQSDALDHVEALRSDVAHSRFALRNLPRPPQKRGQTSRGGPKPDGTLLQVTISVGVAADAGEGEAPETLLRAADAAMYRAKAAGRNRVMA